MRSFRCPVTDHNSEAFGMSRDGKIHCWSCDFGGDLLLAIALGSGLKIDTDFPRVLEIAAGIAGVGSSDDPFGAGPARPQRPSRPEPPPLRPLAERVGVARRYANWIWQRMLTIEQDGTPELYLKSRGIPAASVKVMLGQGEQIRTAPFSVSPEVRQTIDRGTAASDLVRMWNTMGAPAGVAMAIPVRHVLDGTLVDIRCRRIEPRQGQNKIVGMVGGVTTSAAEGNRPRTLVGCYGDPHDIDNDHVICVEGALDYLTARALWPNCQILGAVDAGSIALVAGHAARTLAGRDRTSRLTIVEQADPPRAGVNGKIIPGAADFAVNEQPNAAAKVAIAALGPRRVGWIFCNPEHCEQAGGAPEVDGHPVKDLNDVMRAGADMSSMFAWWPEPTSDM